MLEADRAHLPRFAAGLSARTVRRDTRLQGRAGSPCSHPRDAPCFAGITATLRRPVCPLPIDRRRTRSTSRPRRANDPRLGRHHRVRLPGRRSASSARSRRCPCTRSVTKDLAPPSALTEYTLPEETVVLDRTGEVELARFGEFKRDVVTFEEIPPILLDATTAIEDKTFWENAGFDPLAIVAAGIDSLRGNSRGASTITQQLVRARLLDASSSRTRTAPSSASSRRSSSRSG